MSCGPAAGKFRLLDAYVGWSEASIAGLIGLDDPSGLRLAPVDPSAIGPAVWDYLLPPRLARGCGECDLYLLTPSPSRLLRRRACAGAWTPMWSPACDPGHMEQPIAVAAHQHQLALADAGAGMIRVWSRDGASLLAEIAFPGIEAIGFAANGDLLAVGGRRIERYAPGGTPRGAALALPVMTATPLVVAGDATGGVWLLTREDDGTMHLWHALAGATAMTAATLAQLAGAGFAPTAIAVLADEGFCLREVSRGGMPVTECCSWYGRDVDPALLIPATEPGLVASGTLATHALNSGVPRCRWHRVQLDADVPPGTALQVMVATLDDAGVAPHPDDWQTIAHGASDFLIDQPPGQYLYVRIVLSGDGVRTPVVRRVQLDFPRSTSLDSLPPVYRDNPRAEDFSERFLSLFDAGMAEIDAALDQFPAALDGASVRAELLPWLASFLDLVFDPSWDVARQRAILAALPRLYRLRGTVAGLQLALRLVFDADVAIQELVFERAWGSLGGSAALGSVRLFGKARARFALGRSSLSSAPLKSYGNPDLDPVSSGAYRFRVLVPPGPEVTPLALLRVARLVESQKPAHTQATVRSGGAGFVLGSFSALGIDTAFAPLPAPVLGAGGSVRLGRMSVLWPARRGGHSVFVLGNPLVAGVQTILE
jgi:phage tail-like protein